MHTFKNTLVTIGCCLLVAGLGPQAQAQIRNTDLAKQSQLPADQQSSLAAVQEAVRANPANAPEIVRDAISQSVAGPITYSGAAVAAALRGAGKSVNRVGIALLINAASKAQPAAILQIVQVATRNTSSHLHRDVVASATLASTNPNQSIKIVKTESGGSGDGAIGYEPAGSGLTLAAAILTVALNAAGSPGSLADAATQAKLNAAKNGGGGFGANANSLNATFLNPLLPEPTPPPVSQ